MPPSAAPIPAQLPLSASLITAAAAQVLSQLFKVAYYSFAERRFRPELFVSPGGMPSAHSAFVTALTVSLGLWRGFDSDYFSLGFVFSVIVIYDSFRLRGTVQLHSRLLEAIARRVPGVEPVQLPRMVGHTPLEVGAGVLAGGLFSGLAWFVLRAYSG